MIIIPRYLLCCTKQGWSLSFWSIMIIMIMIMIDHNDDYDDDDVNDIDHHSYNDTDILYIITLIPLLHHCLL